jgi:PII-like signaling protein
MRLSLSLCTAQDSPVLRYSAAWVVTAPRAATTDKILRLSQDLPIVIEVVEETQRVEQILPKLDAMVAGGLITLEKVRVILYRSSR